MKRYLIIFVAVIVACITAASYFKSEKPEEEYLRIHIRADSNAEEDQAVKYEIKDAVVNYLTPFIAECDSKEKAEKVLKSRISFIEEISDGILEKNGFNYKSRAKLTREEFPSRNYGNLTLEKGIYAALIIELGSGKGDNWWCVVYPPLCFTGSGAGYIYKSKIYEIIKNFFDKGE